jgi:hypothetical protein
MIDCVSSLPVKGFLGTGATFEADLNLVVQLVMGAALRTGACLAKQKRYRAHGICQTLCNSDSPRCRPTTILNAITN